jgi:glycosyltransferase involved in cell wall biosynthesis
MKTLKAADECNPLVSVVLPSYNHRQFVSGAIRSVYRQTYRPIELIIIDDGSSDNSAEVIRGFLDDTPLPEGITVHFSARENRGAPATINEGIKAAHGAYITILNSDDAYFPDRIAACVAAARKRDSQLLFTYVEPIDADDKPAEHQHPWRSWYSDALMQELDLSPSVGFVLLTRNIAVTTGNLFFHRDLYDKVGPFADFRYAHDLDFLMKALEIEEPVLLREPLYWYRLHGSNTINVADEVIDDELEKIYRRYFRATLTNPPRNPMAPTFATWPSTLSFTFGPLSRGLNRAIDGLLERPKSLPSAEREQSIAAKQSATSAAGAITLVSHELSRTGAPMLALEVARSILNAGAKVNVISLVDGPLRAEFEQAGIPVKVLRGRALRRSALVRFLTKFLRPIARLDQRGTLRHAALTAANALNALMLYPHIRNRVLINSFASWPIALQIIQYRRRARISWYIHESYSPELTMRTSAARRLFSEICQRSNIRFLFGSDGTRRIWARSGCDGQVRYWSGLSSKPPGNGHSIGTDRRDQENGFKKPRVVLSVGAATPRKGMPTLIEAFAYGRSHGLIEDDVELVIVGCPPPTSHALTRDLLLRVHRRDVRGKVRLVGIVEAGELERYYAEASVYVQSSTMECLPLALLHAMAHALPIVSTDVDGCPEAIVDGVCGLTVPPRDIMHLAAAIGRLLTNPAEARMFGDAARNRFVKKFSLEATANTLLQTLFPEGTVELPVTKAGRLRDDADANARGRADQELPAESPG